MDGWWVYGFIQDVTSPFMRTSCNGGQ